MLVRRVREDALVSTTDMTRSAIRGSWIMRPINERAGVDTTLKLLRSNVWADGSHSRDELVVNSRQALLVRIPWFVELAWLGFKRGFEKTAAWDLCDFLRGAGVTRTQRRKEKIHTLNISHGRVG